MSNNSILPTFYSQADVQAQQQRQAQQLDFSTPLNLSSPTSNQNTAVPSQTALPQIQPLQINLPPIQSNAQTWATVPTAFLETPKLTLIVPQTAVQRPTAPQSTVPQSIDTAPVASQQSQRISLNANGDINCAHQVVDYSKIDFLSLDQPELSLTSDTQACSSSTPPCSSSENVTGSDTTEVTLPVEKQASPLSLLSTTMPTPLTANQNSLIQSIIAAEDKAKEEIKPEGHLPGFVQISEDFSFAGYYDSEGESEGEGSEEELSEVKELTKEQKEQDRNLERTLKAGMIMAGHVDTDSEDEESVLDIKESKSDDGDDEGGEQELVYEDVEVSDPLEINKNEKYVMEILTFLSSRNSKHTNFAIFVSQLRHDYPGMCAGREDIIKAVMLANEYSSAEDKSTILKLKDTDPLLLYKMCILSLHTCEDIFILKSKMNDLQNLTTRESIVNAVYLIAWLDFTKYLEKTKLNFEAKKKLILNHLIIQKLIKNLSAVDNINVLKEDLLHVKNDIFRMLEPCRMNVKNEESCYDYIEDFLLMSL